MLFYRLVKARHSATTLDGEGARRVGGRWNAPGIPLAYGAFSLSLAVLELLVHADPGDVPDDLAALRFEIPGDVAMSRWMAGVTGVLLVPSVIVPVEMNVLVNPRHPDAARIRLSGQEPFPLDPRLGL